MRLPNHYAVSLILCLITLLATSRAPGASTSNNNKDSLPQTRSWGNPPQPNALARTGTQASQKTRQSIRTRPAAKSRDSLREKRHKSPGQKKSAEVIDLSSETAEQRKQTRAITLKRQPKPQEIIDLTEEADTLEYPHHDRDTDVINVEEIGDTNSTPAQCVTVQKIGFYQLTADDMECLDWNNPLNDQIINACFYLLNQLSPPPAHLVSGDHYQNQKPTLKTKIHLVDSFFYINTIQAKKYPAPREIDTGVNAGEQHRMSDKKRPWDKLVIPINCTQLNHWYLAVISTSNQTLTFYSSSPLDYPTCPCCDNLSSAASAANENLCPACTTQLWWNNYRKINNFQKDIAYRVEKNTRIKQLTLDNSCGLFTILTAAMLACHNDDPDTVWQSSGLAATLYYGSPYYFIRASLCRQKLKQILTQKYTTETKRARAMTTLLQPETWKN